MDTITLGRNSDQLIELAISILMVLAAIIIGRWIIILLVDRGIRYLVRKSETSLDDAIVNAFRTPTYLLFVIFVTEAAVRRLDFLPEGSPTVANLLRTAGMGWRSVGESDSLLHDRTDRVEATYVLNV